MKSSLYIAALASALSLSVGCGSTASTTPESSGAAATTVVNGEKYLLAEEPDDAVGVIEARETASNGDPLVIVGRIGGSDKPWVEGRAAFMLLDASMALVAEGTESGEGEVCMGDCCANERAECTTLVKVVDNGALVPADSRQLLGVKENDFVVIRGKASKDESGNFTVLADGVFIRR
jgi:hypothetical protein